MLGFELGGGQMGGGGEENSPYVKALVECLGSVKTHMGITVEPRSNGYQWTNNFFCYRRISIIANKGKKRNKG